MYTRLARVRGWGSGSAGGIHLHHMVIGIVLVSGLLAVAFWPSGSPWRELIAIFFGAGAALTLDEFALWLYLRDVYWCEEGRSSIDATVMGVVLAALLLVGSSPFGIGGGGETPAAIVFGMVAFQHGRRRRHVPDDLLGGAPSIGLPAMRMEIVGGRLMMKGLQSGRSDRGGSDREQT